MEFLEAHQQEPLVSGQFRFNQRMSKDMQAYFRALAEDGSAEEMRVTATVELCAIKWRGTRLYHGSNAISDLVQPTTFVIEKLEDDALNELQTITKDLHRSGDDEQLTLGGDH